MRQVFAPDKPADLQSETSSTTNNQTNKHYNNKSRVPTLLRNDRATKLHPAISVHSPGEVVKAIFLPSKFTFDIVKFIGEVDIQRNKQLMATDISSEEMRHIVYEYL